MQRPYSKHLMFSVLLHMVLLTVLVVSFEFSMPMPVVNNAPEVIEATVVDALPSTKKIIQKALPEPPAPPKPKPEIPKKAVDVIPPPKKVEAIAIPDKKQQKIQEDLIQKELLADMQKLHEKQQKKIKQKNLQADLEKEMEALKAKTVQSQKIPDQKRITNTLSASAKGVVDKYKALILQAISQHWLIPANADKKRFAELLIRVAPGGMVLDVQLTKSSGDDALDRSARAAVWKSSPLPVPTNPDDFEPFKQFVLKVKPSFAQA